MKRWWWSGAVFAGCWPQLALPAASLAAVFLEAVSLAAVSLAAVAWAAPAVAAPAADAGATLRHPLDWLDWEAPVGCPERAVVYARTREAAGFAPELGRFERVRGVIVPARQGYLLTLEFFEAGSQRSRSIEAHDCGDLEGAAAVAVALALGNGNEVPSAAPSESAPGERDTPALVPASADVPGTGELGWRGSLAGLLDLSSVSQPSWGLGVDARARWDALELGLFGLWIPASQRGVGAGESVQFGLLAGGPLACWRWRVLLQPAACAALEVGQLSADGSGLSENPRQFSSLWVAPSLALELQQPLTRAWGLQLRAQAVLPLLHERYTVNDSETVYETPAAVFRLYLGVGWSWE